MILEPQTRISEQALKVWRLSGTIQSVFVSLAGVALIILSLIFSWPIWIIGAAVIVMLSYSYLNIYLFPSLRWKRWRYEVREQEIELRQGIFIIKRTLVPMIRVQHVDTRQGPLLRKYGLATVAISTAATVHEIPAVDVGEAEELRFFISKLARVADEDV
ncbi:hypothetical protein CU633_11030 [Bacillus sp. V3-13]|uniref:PH domain-containing protein n=1 Tax=Bacillus sp. V3-13 TaxID=2053728 RepID=UPI000C76E687|nr:PH domain-containing protein [Bacillus sp. V3-13]PLR77300.1 hypothetical protein CU633_11030 [Bacillus sp. V3-13]